MRPNKEKWVTVGIAPVWIHCQEESGLYRAEKLQARVWAFRNEMPMIMVLMSLLRPHSTFVDCGANVGLWSANVAAMSPIVPGLRVLAFEPHPETFVRLQKTAARFPNLECHNLALSDQRRELELAEGAGSQTFGVPKSHFQISNRLHRVEARPLDDFLGGHERIFIKIDVEGHEYEVLCGARGAMKDGRVQAILIDGCDPPYRQRILDELNSFGFELRDLRSLEPLGPKQDRILAIRRV